MAERKAASVLPEPVGATTRVSRPALIDSQASDCAGVGAAKAASNQPWVAGEKSGTGPSSWRGRDTAC